MYGWGWGVTGGEAFGSILAAGRPVCSQIVPAGQVGSLTASLSYAGLHADGAPVLGTCSTSELCLHTAHRAPFIKALYHNPQPSGQGNERTLASRPGVDCSAMRENSQRWVRRDGISGLTERGDPSSPKGETSALYVHVKVMGTTTPAWIPIDKTACLPPRGPCPVPVGIQKHGY